MGQRIEHLTYYSLKKKTSEKCYLFRGLCSFNPPCLFEHIKIDKFHTQLKLFQLKASNDLLEIIQSLI